MKKIRLKTPQNHPAIKAYVAAVKKGIKELTCEKHSRILIAKSHCVDCQAENQTSQDWEKTLDSLFSPYAEDTLVDSYTVTLIAQDLASVKKELLELLAKEKETARREERERCLALALLAVGNDPQLLDIERNKTINETKEDIKNNLKAVLTNPSESYQSRLNEHNSNSAGSEKKA